MTKYNTSYLPGRTANVENEGDLLHFSGTDYLGMGHNEEFRTYLEEGLKSYGSHYGSSRNNSLQLSVYQEAEDRLSRYTGAPAALTVSSGMWAGQLVMKEIEHLVCNLTPFSENSVSQYHYAPKVHPALWANNHVTVNSSWKDWAKDTIQTIKRSDIKSAHIICSDSVGSPWVETFDFSIFEALPDRGNIFLIVDDSHGLGITGNSGNGIYQRLAVLKNVRLIVVASLNKAMGIPAGAILAEENIILRIRSSPWFSGASPSVPAYSYALNRFLATDSYQKVYEKLIDNIRYFQNLISGLTLFSAITDYPVFCSQNTSLFQFLLDHKIMTSSFSYPLATDLPVTRLVINALHQKEDLDKLAEVCIKFQSEN